MFYLQKGRARVTVVSQRGKEATITLLSARDFVGEESLAAIIGLRMATATAVNTCTALKISRNEMVRVMHDEPAFADIVLKFLLARSMRTQADLVDQLFNSSEKRLARILLIMAEFGKPGEPETFIPPITQETLADMIGTTRSRVSFFMNRFRKLGFISYNGRIQVHKSLLNVVLLDQLPDHNAQKPAILPSRKATSARCFVHALHIVAELRSNDVKPSLATKLPAYRSRMVYPAGCDLEFYSAVASRRISSVGTAWSTDLAEGAG